jgi:Gpi18-like mannosyltransferase
MAPSSSTSHARRESLGRLVWRLDTAAGLVAMFGLALLVRVLIAPHAGFYIDLNFFRTWATELREVGPHGLYAKDHLVDYPPGYLYVLWLIGTISSAPGYLLLKLPAILADLGLAWIAGTFAARLAPPAIRKRMPVRALVVAGVLFNPAVIALSSVWGQVDSIPVLLVLSSLLLLFTGARSLQRDVAAFLLFALAISMKPQSGLVLPVMFYALYRRYLHRRTVQELIDGLLSIGVIGVLSLGVWFVTALPFGLGPVSLIRFYHHSASLYPVTSSNAFNFWGIVAFWRPDSSGDYVAVAGIPALYFGVLAAVIAIAVVLWRVHRAIEHGADEAYMLTAAAAIVSLVSYALLTRMHERYVFLSLACLAPLVFVRLFRLAYVALSGLLILNLWYAYADFNSRSNVQDFRFNPWFDWIFGGFQTDPWQKKVLSLAVTAIALTVAWAGVRWAEQAIPRGERDQVRLQRVIEPRAGRESPLRRLWDTVQTDETFAVEPKGQARWGPIALVALACAFCLFVLRSETTPAMNLNDSVLHEQMVRWASGQIHEGRVPLDGWYPYFSLGSSFFHHYQSLPHTLTAYTARATGASDQTTYLWFQYLLLALWPVAVYCSARLFGWGRWSAAAAAAVSPLIVSTPAYGYEHGSYTWQGFGVYSQLWGMWLLPLAWGLTWRAVARGKRYAVAALALALTMASHFITGYLAMLTVGVWVLVLGFGAGFARRVGRAAIVAAGSTLIASWVLVPLIGDSKWSNETEYYKGTFFNDSFGARKVLGWLFTGQLFDGKRFPIVTILFFVGFLVCVLRCRFDIRARALLGAFTLSLLLFFGRPTLGPVLKLLPGFGDVQIHRFIVGVQLAGILMAGVGLTYLFRLVSAATHRLLLGRLVTAVIGAACVLLMIGVLAPAWTERASYDQRDATLISRQRVADASDGRDIDRLIAIVTARHDGRVYAGLRGNWGQQYRIGEVPVHAWLGDRDVDAIGYVFRTITSLSTDVEVAFDENNPAQYQMLNIRYLILPSDRQPSVPAKLIESSGRHRLYKVPTSGYFQVVDRSAPIAANRADIEAATREWRNSGLASQAIYPGIAFAGAAGPAPTFTGSRPPDGPPGKVLVQSNTLQNGDFSATVVANRRAVVLLKATYDPRWTAIVDGRTAKAAMMAPSLVGVEVAAGRHVVRFKYQPYPHYPLLFAIGAITLFGLALYPRRARASARLIGLART